MDNFQIRRLRVEDAEEITRIYAEITRRPVEPDFKKVVEEHAQSGDEACFVAEHQGKVVGFMISYILTFGFGIERLAMRKYEIADIRWLYENDLRFLNQF